jgi:flagellar hook-associated protein 1 FlgK
MRGTFFGFEIARRALLSQQQALDVTGHNIANAATPGYSRQQIQLRATTPITNASLQRDIGTGQLGTGVTVAGVNRQRDGFTDYQYRNEQHALGYSETREFEFERLEGIFNEPSDNGLAAMMDKFYAAWQELSRDGSSESARAVVREQGVTVADTINSMNRKLNELTADITKDLTTKVDNTNSLIRQIADLNGQIKAAELTGQAANDLRDRRDVLVDDLSKLVNIEVYTTNDEYAIVSNGMSLVRHTASSELSVDVDGNLQWGQDKLAFNPLGGSLKGYSSMLETTQKYREELGQVAQQLASTVNAKHRAGYNLNEIAALNPSGDLPSPTGNDFFVLTSSGDTVIAVNPLINPSDPAQSKAALRLIAAAAPNAQGALAAGDGSNARDIAQLSYSFFDPAGGTNTVNVHDTYRSLLGELGVASQEARSSVENEKTLSTQLENRRDSVSGVSLDEEMVNMMQYQQAYNAAARVLSVYDELIDTIINRLGAGR